MDKPTRRFVAVLLTAGVLFLEQVQGAERPIPVSELDRALVHRVREFVGPALAARVEIAAKDGRVTLRGTVDSAEKRRLLEQKAEEIAGRKLENQTQIAGTTQK